MLKRLTICSIWVVLLGCSDLPRDNPLDPKNSESQRPRVVLAEVFVTDDPDAQFCTNALDALMQLEGEFGNTQLLILEYHLRNPGKWQDDFATDDANVRYNEMGVAELGVPDVFFDGASGRVQGAHSAETAYQRYRPVLEEEANSSGLFTIEVAKTKGADQITVGVTVARLGNTTVRNINVRGVVVHDLGADRHRHVVSSLLREHAIEKLEAGELKDLTFEVPFSPGSEVEAELVLFIQEEGGERKVLQACSVHL